MKFISLSYLYGCHIRRNKLVHFFSKLYAFCLVDQSKQPSLKSYHHGGKKNIFTLQLNRGESALFLLINFIYFSFSRTFSRNYCIAKRWDIEEMMYLNQSYYHKYTNALYIGLFVIFLNYCAVAKCFFFFLVCFIS